MRISSLFAALSVGVVLCGCDEAGFVADAEAPVSAPAAVPAPAAQQVPAAVPDAAFDTALNALRARNGLGPATPDARLMAAAQRHAEDMVANGYFAHRSRDGRTYIQRIAAEGYPTCWPVENIANGQSSAAAAFASWANSPPHRRNMLTDGTVEYGIGRAGNIHVLDLARVC